MAVQSAERRRCLSCNRWGGARRPADAAEHVEYDEENDRGPCQEGPWHGSLRKGPRNACGQWLRWVEISPATPDVAPAAAAPPESPESSETSAPLPAPLPASESHEP
jgi:hypothetical protein